MRSCCPCTRDYILVIDHMHMLYTITSYIIIIIIIIVIHIIYTIIIIIITYLLAINYTIIIIYTYLITVYNHYKLHTLYAASLIISFPLDFHIAGTIITQSKSSVVSVLTFLVRGRCFCNSFFK